MDKAHTSQKWALLGVMNARSVPTLRQKAPLQRLFRVLASMRLFSLQLSTAVQDSVSLIRMCAMWLQEDCCRACDDLFSAGVLSIGSKTDSLLLLLLCLTSISLSMHNGA